MGRIKKRLAVKLFTGLIFKDNTVYAKTKAILEKKFGPVDFESEALDFGPTDYYAKELGENLKRRFLSFQKLILPEQLAAIKLTTNRFESRLSKNALRRINIDPGYLELSKLVLPTTKDYKHRLYLGYGIYAEITLFYRGNTFCPWEWTYPDYRTDAYIGIFNKIREIYLTQIKKA